MSVDTLVIGGHSRVARALRRLRPGGYDYVIRSAARRTTSPDQSDEVTGCKELIVESYQDLSLDHLRGYATVINLVGTTRGTPDELMAVNAGLPRHLAAQAVSAGVAHFIALSSFSVFGTATRLGKDTPLNPNSPYGRSRLAGEENVAQFAETMTCTIARCPILYGAGDSKLERLVALWCKGGMLPVPKTPVLRSMVHYDLAARYLDEIARSTRTEPGLTIDHFADPVPFEYRMAARILSANGGKRKRAVALPDVVFRLFSAVVPNMARSLFSDSVLEGEDNYFKSPADSRIERDLAQMADANRSIA